MNFEIKRISDYSDTYTTKKNFNTLADLCEFSVQEKHKIVLDGRDNTIVVFDESRCRYCYGDMDDYEFCE